jgi:hypothetical protein
MSEEAESKPRQYDYLPKSTPARFSMLRGRILPPIGLAMFASIILIGVNKCGSDDEPGVRHTGSSSTTVPVSGIESLPPDATTTSREGNETAVTTLADQVSTPTTLSEEEVLIADCVNRLFSAMIGEETDSSTEIIAGNNWRRFVDGRTAVGSPEPELNRENASVAFGESCTQFVDYGGYLDLSA